ncbi:hypothetical protein DYL61_16530 [Pseudomonas nabeulensis]|uniref:Uncharacterized protein n=1 Tax=Pseudomonas nabeulensis TaxID=2293833 RepID=A0A4Z0B2S0_9PSED|nr:hypothetical protein [Pseudomonas nabeulensis]TFY93000.1 hypothetical protein DYL61_16530 [Pseudomonas nabeulensis]
MSDNTTQAPTLIVPERITIVLKAQEGSTLEHICQFVSLGMPVAIGRGMAVISGASDEDLQMVLGQERDERQMQAQLQQEAIGAPAHLAAHAQEMFDLLLRINTKCGGLDAALGHGIEPSDQMWTESREAMEDIWDLLDKVKSAEVFGSPSLITENPAVTDSMHIDDRVRMAANAGRYEWLRDRTCIEDADNDIMVVRGDQYFDGDELDREIDNALRLARLEESPPCAD